MRWRVLTSLLALLGFFEGSALAQPITALTTSDSNIGMGQQSSVTMGGILYFPWCGSEGCELWRTDGSSAGTRLVKDIEAGPASSSPSGLTLLGTTLYFAAYDSTNGRELWKSDGTLAGTVLVRNIASGATSSSPSHLTAAGGRLIFSAYESSSFGNELWTSTGTSATTTRVADIYPGGTSSSPEELTLVGGLVYFSAEHPTYGRELWRTDGTLAGTSLVSDLVPGAGWSDPRKLRRFGPSLLFAAHTAASGNELFRTDGGAAQMVKDIFPGSGSSDPSELVVSGALLYFSARNSTDGHELWRSDGTDAGTFSVKDIRPGLSGSFPRDLRVSGSVLFFAADNGVTGYELWKSDGSPAGTLLVKDLWTGPGPSSPTNIEPAPDGVIFAARGTDGSGLYHSDGTPEGTTLVTQTVSSTFGEIDEVVAFGSGMVVSASAPFAPFTRLSFLSDPSQGPSLSFTASTTLVNPLGASTLSWSAAAGSSLTLNGVPVPGPSGSQIVNPGATTTYTLLATAGSAVSRRTVTVYVNDGTVGLGAPAVTSPSSGQNIVVTGVGFTWTPVAGATGYDLRVLRSSSGVLFVSGSLLGGTSTSTLISLPEGSYQFAVRACSGGFTAAQCGSYGTVSFTVSPAAPSSAPNVTFPTQGATLTSSTQTLSWTSVSPNPILPGLNYEVVLRDVATSTTALQITVASPSLSTIFTMHSSSQYELRVRACQAGCGPYSAPVTFAVTLPARPTTAPSGVSCSVNAGNLTCSWGAVVNADAYQVQVVQAPPAGPGGGALTVAAKQVSARTVTLPVPAGSATVFIAACNGDGCGPNAQVSITAAGPNSAQPNLGTPMAGTVVTGPGTLFTWNRVPGDNGSNTFYRLYVQDLSRQAAALDVFTTSNFYSALFKAEGGRYDALVISNPGLGNQATGPAQGFNVAGSSATAPTMVSPAHNSSIASGNIQLGWSPVPGATLYEYFVAVLGVSSASVRGVTPALLARVPLRGIGPGTVYSGIVRACPAGATCVAGSDAGWGPWSNAPGGPGVTNFTVLP